MSTRWSSILVISTVGSVIGCAPLATPGPHQPIAGSVPSGAPATRAALLPVQMAPVPVWRTGASGVEASYLQGRAAHGAGQLAQARQHYQDVLDQAPRHIGALNALAVIHAQQGDLPAAMTLFTQAMTLTPDTAHLHNNAGYALLRAGRLEEARDALERAQALDPANGNTRRNLAEVRDLLAAQAPKADRAVDTRMTAATTQAPGAQLVSVSPNVYELRLPLIPSAQPVPSKPAVASAIASVALVAPGQPVKMEIANGAGVANLARRTAERLAPLGWVAARLSNARPYRQQVTEIQFRAGQQASATALQGQLPVATRTIAVEHLGPGVQMRLVLGHDLNGKTVAAWLDAPGEPLRAEYPGELRASRPGDDGWSWG